MADIQKGSPSGATIIAVLLAAVVIGFCLAQVRGSRDGCEAQGGKPHGLECVQENGEPK